MEKAAGQDGRDWAGRAKQHTTWCRASSALGCFSARSRYGHPTAARCRPDGDHCGSAAACKDHLPDRQWASPAPYKLDAPPRIPPHAGRVKNQGTRSRRISAKRSANASMAATIGSAVCHGTVRDRKGRASKTCARANWRAGIGRKWPARRWRVSRVVCQKSTVKRIGRDSLIRNVLIAIGTNGDDIAGHEAERLLGTKARWCGEPGLGSHRAIGRREKFDGAGEGAAAAGGPTRRSAREWLAYSR